MSVHQDGEEKRPGATQWVPLDVSLPQLRRAADECRGCELWRDATQVVFSIGSRGTRIMVVGEQPGDQEDSVGEPFVGPAEQLLREALTAVGIDPDDVYLTNAVKHFRHRPDPRGGKRRIHQKPGTAHVIACRPWLTRELDLVSPRVVVALGATAGRSILGRPVKVGTERGIAIPAAGLSAGIREPPVAVVLTTHPSAVLRLRGKSEYDQAFDNLVKDLTVALGYDAD